MSASAVRIPVFTVPRLAVRLDELPAMLGWEDKSREAQRRLVWKFCAKHGIRKHPGNVVSLRAVEQALEAAA